MWLIDRLAAAFLVAILIAVAGVAQKQLKPWNEWTRKDAENILSDSPWSQTQVETDTSEMVYTPTVMGDTRSRETQGATNQATSVKFYIRLFSSRPVRQAYVRLLDLSQAQPDQNAVERRHAWANLAASDSIIVTVAYDSPDKRYLGRVTQAFNSAVTAVLKNSAYLERKDGKRVFLGEYVPPGKDVFGARFIFPRMLEGEPFIRGQEGSLRFHAEYENKNTLDSANNPAGQTNRSGATSSNSSGRTESSLKLKLDMKFKLADMSYNGVLEY
ncbi:MAG: hypothetical protein AABM67_09025 [Acidobacteriota bacterium]